MIKNKIKDIFLIRFKQITENLYTSSNPIFSFTRLHGFMDPATSSREATEEREELRYIKYNGYCTVRFCFHRPVKSFSSGEQSEFSDFYQVSISTMMSHCKLSSNSKHESSFRSDKNEWVEEFSSIRSAKLSDSTFSVIFAYMMIEKMIGNMVVKSYSKCPIHGYDERIIRSAHSFSHKNYVQIERVSLIDIYYEHVDYMTVLSEEHVQ